jgi:hypothetical protein
MTIEGVRGLNSAASNTHLTYLVDQRTDLARRTPQPTNKNESTTSMPSCILLCDTPQADRPQGRDYSNSHIQVPSDVDAITRCMLNKVIISMTEGRLG